MAAKFRLMWENNPDTPISASSLSTMTKASSEYGGMLYKDIPELLPNGLYSDGFLKIRANTHIAINQYTTQALLFNTNNSLVSHNSKFGPIVQDNIVFQKYNTETIIYAGEGTTNLFSNPSFNSGLLPEWQVALQDEPQIPGYVDPIWGEEYAAKVEIVTVDGEKCVRMFNGSFGRTEILRQIDLKNKPIVSLSFYYKSTGGLKCYLTSGGLYWKNGDWNPSTSATYDLPSTNGEWKRMEIKNIITQKIQDTAELVELLIYSDAVNMENFIKSFQLEEHMFVSPYVDGIRNNSILKYPHQIIDINKGYIDINIYPKSIKDFTIFSLTTSTVNNALQLSYKKDTDQFEFKIYDILTQSYIQINSAAKLADRIDGWMKIICGWDRNTGIKIITSSSPTIELNFNPFIPMTSDYFTSFDISSNRNSDIGNFFINTFKINTGLKDDVDIMKDYQKQFITVDEDVYKIFHVDEEAIIIDETMIENGSYAPNTSYYVIVVDNLNDNDSYIIVSTSEKLEGIDDLLCTTLGGFKTDASANPVNSSIWDITTKKYKRIHTDRFMVGGTNIDNYKFDIRTTPLAETNDVRSTIPINFTNNLYGRHQSDIYNTNVQYFEANKEGWVGIDNIKIDGNKISTRNYSDNNGLFNNDLELTVSNVGNIPKIWIHAHEIDIDSGDRDIKLDDIRIDDNIIYTKPNRDLYIDVTHTDDPTDRNDIYIESQDINVKSNNITTFETNSDFVVNINRDVKFSVSRDFIVNTGGIIKLDTLIINNNSLYSELSDTLIYSSNNNVDINSSINGIITLDDIIIKNSTIYKTNGNITIETPDDIYIGRPHTSGDPTEPHQTNVVIRSDNFIVESKNVSFSNVNASDFIKFDDLRIQQSQIYTQAAIPISINSSGSLTLQSNANIYFNTNNIIELQDTGGSFISKVDSTFTKDLTVKNINFSDVGDTQDSARIFTEVAGGTTTKLKIQVSNDSIDKIIIEHKAAGQSSGNAMMQIGQDDVIIAKDLVVQGNLTIQGESTTLNTATLLVEDNIITLNSNVTGAPTLDSGIEINRGTLTGVKLKWNEADDRWQLSNGIMNGGNEIFHNIIFNGYDERFSENVNVVTSEPAGFKLENDLAVGGMELLNPDQIGGMIRGQAVMNIGLHMNQTAGYIKDKLMPDGTTYDANSIGAWMSIDTRPSENKFKWVWESAGSNVENIIATLNNVGLFTTNDIQLLGTGNRTGGQITFKSNPGGGTDDTAYIKYYAMGASGENTALEFFIGNEIDDVFKFVGGNVIIDNQLTVSGNLVATRQNSPTANAIPTWNNTAKRFDTTSVTISGSTITGSLSGNATTATTLQTARNIGGVSFDGSANINLPGVNIAGNQSTSGNAATATTLQTARTIGGVSFNGSANINLPGVNIAGNQNTSGTAASADAVRGVNFYTGATAPSGTTQLNCDGYFSATRVYNAVYNDIAEYFLSDEKEQPGKVYAIENGKIVLSQKRAAIVVGVCSDSAAMIMKDEYRDRGIVIGLTGTVKTWVKSKFKAGDELVSDIGGFAIKANMFEKLFKRSTIIGKALESSYDNTEKRILVLIK